MFRTQQKLVVSALLLTCTICGAQQPVQYFTGLLSAKREERINSLQAAQQERDERVQQLIAIVRRDDVDTSDGGSLDLAISLLGQYRAREAVAPLAERLSYLPTIPKDGYMSNGFDPRESFYPCVSALVSIGEPSDVIETMTRKIRMSDVKLERELAAWVVMRLQGRQQTLNIFAAAAKGSGEKSQQKLRLASDYIKNYKAVMGDPRLDLTNRKPYNPQGRRKPTS